MRGAHILIKRLSPYEWCFLAFKLSLGLVWPLAFLDSDRTDLVEVVFTYFWILCCFGGLIVSAWGMIMSKAHNPVLIARGMRMELGGLYLFLAGPACYATMVMVMYFARGLDTDALGQFFLGLACSAAILARAHLVKESADKK